MSFTSPMQFFNLFESMSWLSATSTIAILTTTLSILLPRRRMEWAVKGWSRLVGRWVDSYAYREIEEFIEAFDANIVFDEVQAHLQSHLQSAVNSTDPSAINMYTNRCSLVRSRDMTVTSAPRLTSGEMMELYYDPQVGQIIPMTSGMRKPRAAVKMIWMYQSTIRPQAGGVRTWQQSWGEEPNKAKQQDEERRQFTLLVLKRHVQYITPYMDLIKREAAEQRAKDTAVRIWCIKDNSRYGQPPAWTSLKFQHNSTFDSLCMDAAIKRLLLDDLQLFMLDQEFYQRTGKPNKRSYLLFGPPGTGKTSCVAAIAHKYRFSIYDLDLGQCNSNAQLRHIVMKIPSRSIVLMEDIDRQLPASVIGSKKAADKAAAAAPPALNRMGQPLEKITTSGLLNMLDGLWSGVADQRIFIATSNHPKDLDPALLRSGRFDMKLELTYATSQMLVDLVKTHLNLTDYTVPAKLDPKLKQVLSRNLCPCDISEQLVRRRQMAPDRALDEVLDALTELCDEKEQEAKQLKQDEEKARVEAEAEKAKAEADKKADVVGSDAGNEKGKEVQATG